jgi:beta-glucosidase
MKIILSIFSVFFINSLSAQLYEKEVDSLLSKMSIEEKVGQMTQVNITVLAKNKVTKDENALDTDKLNKALKECYVGSVLNALEGRKHLEGWHEIINTIQKIATEETPNNIPVLYGVDAIHGATYITGSTLFPHNIGISASRNPELAKKSAHITAMETRASGVRWNFDPVLDIGRMPLWPRFPETYGEDPILCEEFGIASIIGYEGDDLKNIEYVASCMKHFVGYSKPETGFDRTPAYIPERQLREYYLPQFKAAVEAGSKTIMINSGEINGIPTHANKYLLQTVLREELGFKGIVVTDWQDIIYLHTKHKIAKTHKEAVKIAIESGIDMSMVPLKLDFYYQLLELVKEGEISEARIDESVKRILRLKFELGLFENPYVEKEAIKNFGKKEYKEEALKAALESMTLLKNDNEILPLNKKTKVFLAGPSANNKSSLHGCWSYSWQGDDESKYPDSTPTLKDYLSDYLGQKNVICNAVSEYENDKNYDLKGVENADVIILAIGENAYAETPGSITDLSLDQKQKDLVRKAKETGKPIIVVLLEGRPRVLSDVEPYMNAVLQAYWPGEKGAEAIVKTLFGEHNPGGKLPYSYPRHTGHLVMYDCKYSELGVEDTQDGFTYKGYNPQWAFGEGLSYTSFEYDSIKLNTTELNNSNYIEVSVTVKNTGKVAGTEVVELFSRDHYASITPSFRRLRGFKQIHLAPNESKTVTFKITKEDLQFVGLDLKMITEPGKFDLVIKNQIKVINYSF